LRVHQKYKGDLQSLDSILEIIAQGAWNGGQIVDNSIYEEKGLSFKGNIPVNNKTIEERIGVRTRRVAPLEERIGATALQDLLDTSDIDPRRIKMVIGATNVGDDKMDRGPLIRHPYRIIQEHCPDAFVFDLYAGCPGFNVAVGLIFVLSLTGFLKAGDLSIIVGAENIHRAQAFKPQDTANIIFGDDALATALETKASRKPSGQYANPCREEFEIRKDTVLELAHKIYALNGNTNIDGLIIDNQIGDLIHRIPATAVRVQQALVELMYPDEAAKGVFQRFKEAIDFYDRHINGFAYDVMTLAANAEPVETIAKAYVESGKCENVVSVYLGPDRSGIISLHKGSKYSYERPHKGIIDTITRTHGCFARYIQAVADDGDVFGEMDGKGVFLYATRGAKACLNQLFTPNGIKIEDLDLIFEHQANFAMIPLTLEQVLDKDPPEIKSTVADLIANKMVTNVHERGNCSVVCMLRLPYDLQRGTLNPDTLQGFAINRNLEVLKNANLILYDSVGAGMTRSSFLQRKK
jgi:3-oxoacyl-[acyl-carrier-protein] synthase III